MPRYYLVIDYIPHSVHFNPGTHLFCNWKFVTPNFPHLFRSLPTPVIMFVSLTMFLFVMLIVFSVQFSSVAQSCPTPRDPLNCSTPGLPVHHQLPEFTQTHIHRVGDAIQPSHPLSSPSPPAPNPSQHQSLFQ